MMVNVIARLSGRDEQRLMVRWQEEGMDWGEAWAAAAETQDPCYVIWWRCDRAETARRGY